MVSKTQQTDIAIFKTDTFFEELRLKDYKRIDKNKQFYFDYTGGNLYPESLINKHHQFLKENVFGNPHSTNPTSKLATEKVNEARRAVLEYFNATDDYFCIFTPNASGALKIVGECYPFNENSSFVLTFDNHNSVNGLREFCKNKNGHFTYAPMFYDTLQIDENKLNDILTTEKRANNNLFAFPAQSNVSGVKHDLSWIKKAKEMGWDVLLDAAAFVPTNQLDLKQHPADFVSVSFYKIFGFPTGIGCLLVKKDIYPKLKKPWFAGGTVSFAAVQDPIFKLQNDHERFEDGTVNYLHIPAIKNGLDYIKNIGINKINNHVKNITAYLLDTLQNLKHSNGESLIQIYGPKNTAVRGGTIIFNVLNSKGEEMPYTAIEEQANAKNISIRTGCFCNPGIDEINHCISTSDLAKYYSAQDGASFQEMINYLGKMRGAVRISVGFITNKKDIDTLIDFINTFKS